MLDTSAWFSLSGTALLTAATIRVAWVTQKSKRPAENGKRHRRNIWEDDDEPAQTVGSEPDPKTYNFGSDDKKLSSARLENDRPNTNAGSSISEGNLPAGDDHPADVHEADPAIKIAVRAAENGTGTSPTDPSPQVAQPTDAAGTRAGSACADTPEAVQPLPTHPNAPSEPADVVEAGNLRPSESETKTRGSNETAENLPPNPGMSPNVDLESTSEEALGTIAPQILGDTPTREKLTEFRGNFFVIRGLRRV